MKQIICEIRRSWKSKHIIILLFAFLCFFTFVYTGCLSKAKVEYRNLLINQRIDYPVIGSRFHELKAEFEFTPVDEISNELREAYYAWKEMNNNYYDFIVERFDSDYFEDNEAITHAYVFYHELYQIMENNIYKGELDFLDGYSKKEVETKMHFYKYLIDKDIDPYILSTDPNLTNFIRQILNRDYLFLLIVLSVAFLIYQLTHEIESEAYKPIYTLPKKRCKLIVGKIISNYIMILISFGIALLLFSIVPITQYGFGSLAYPYFITPTKLEYFMPLLLKSLLIIALLLFLFLLVGTFMSFMAKSFSKALSFTGAILVSVYFAVRLFGNHIAFSWVPLFYLNVDDIAGENFAIPYWGCILCLIIGILLLAFINYRYIEKMDMEGSDE